MSLNCVAFSLFWVAKRPLEIAADFQQGLERSRSHRGTQHDCVTPEADDVCVTAGEPAAFRQIHLVGTVSVISHVHFGWMWLRRLGAIMPTRGRPTSRT